MHTRDPFTSDDVRSDAITYREDRWMLLLGRSLKTLTNNELVALADDINDDKRSSKLYGVGHDDLGDPQGLMMPQ